MVPIANRSEGYRYQIEVKNEQGTKQSKKVSKVKKQLIEKDSQKAKPADNYAVHLAVWV